METSTNLVDWTRVQTLQGTGLPIDLPGLSAPQQDAAFYRVVVAVP